MKNLFSAILLMPTMAFSQFTILYSQDFQAGGFGGMTMYNDSNTPDDPGVFTDAWINVRWAIDEGTTNRVASSTSYFTGMGTPADRWLITPAIAIPSSGTTQLSFRARSHVDDPGYPDGYKLKVSTTGKAKADFTTTLLNITAAPNLPIKDIPFKIINLAAYQGQTVYFAWVNDNLDKFTISVDDIQIVNTGTLGLDGAQANTDLQVYPNPVTNEFKIANTKNIKKVSVTDASGKMVKEFANASESYDVSSLHPGTYMISVQTETGTETKKMIKK